MQVEATYDNGQLEFARPLRLKPERIRLTVEIPDDAVLDIAAEESAPDGSHSDKPAASSVHNEIEAILGPWRSCLRTLGPISKDERGTLLAAEWNARHREQR